MNGPLSAADTSVHFGRKTQIKSQLMSNMAKEKPLDILVTAEYFLEKTQFYRYRKNRSYTVSLLSIYKRQAPVALFCFF